MLCDKDQIASVWNLRLKGPSVDLVGAAFLVHQRKGFSSFFMNASVGGCRFRGEGNQSPDAPHGEGSWIKTEVLKESNSPDSKLSEAIGSGCLFRGAGTMSDQSASFVGQMYGGSSDASWTLGLVFVEGFSQDTLGQITVNWGTSI